MKKTNLLKGALSVLAVSVLLASCTQVDSRIDTIDTLGTPSVKAVAYPGVNYISWNAVKGAKKYKVTKIVDGGIEESVDSVTVNYVTDSIPTNDVDVEYKVYALSDNEPSSSARAVYVYGSEAGSATVTNIFPPVGTEAKDLPKYEKDSGYKFEADADNSEWKDEFIPTAENIDIQYVDGTIVITAPTKAYLNTTVIGYTGNKEEIYYSDYSDNKKEILPNYQNKKISNKTTITSAGDYKFKAEVRALGDAKENAFYKASNITLTKTVKVPGIETSKSTSDLKVEYIDDAKTTARVVFTPAVSKDGKTYGVENYKVYRALKDSKQLDEVTGLRADSRTNSDKKEVIYVVEDKVPSNTVDYDYYVVLNVDGSLESEPKTVKLNPSSPDKVDPITTLDVNAVALDEDGIENDIIVTVKPATDTKIVAISYGVVDSASNVLDSAYANTIPVETKLADQKQTYLIGKNIEPGKVVIVKAEAAEIKPTGKDNVVRTAKTPVGKVQSAKTAKITVASPSQKNGDKDLLNNDWLNNKIDLAVDTSIVSVKYAFADTVELAKVAAVNGNDITMKVLDYTLGNKNDDYIFDIEDAGTVGQYLGIAVEVKAEGKTNTIAVAASENKVSVNYADAYIECSDKIADSESKKSTLSLDLNLYVNKDTNKVDNYEEFEVSWIEAKNSNYEIDPTAVWTTKTYKISDLTKINDERYTVNVNTLSMPVDFAKDTEYTNKYFVAKLVTKYTVAGAVERNSDPGYKTFTYIINK